MRITNLLIVVGTVVLAAGAAAGQTLDVSAQADDVTLGARHYSPFVDQSYPNRVFWGDTHLHTSYSTDAGMIGNMLGPDEAFYGPLDLPDDAVMVQQDRAYTSPIRYSP